MAKLRVLIAGASIAGPTAAYWFARAGAQVTVIERFPSLRKGGQNIDIRTAGVTVMRRTPGMEAAVKSRVLEIEGISFVDKDGRSYGVIRPTGNPDQQSLVSEYEIYRGDLARILYDLTKDNESVEYVFDEQIVSMRQDEESDGPVMVEFANRLPSSEYDLVVACDGATSRTRAIGLGCGVRDHILPQNSWAAFCSFTKDIGVSSKIGQALSTVPGRFMALGLDPLAGEPNVNRVVFMGINPKNAPDATAPFREAVKQGTDATKKYVAEYFKGAGWKTEEAIEGMFAADDFYASEMAQVKLPALSKGRFVLVGDAGYAPGPTGGGTTLAMAGAYVLAGEIAKHPGDLQAGLAAYEATMRPLIQEMQKIPPFVPELMGPQTAWGLWLRNNIFAFIAWSGIVGFISKYFAGAFANTEKFPLPEYEWSL